MNEAGKIDGDRAVVELRTPLVAVGAVIIVNDELLMIRRGHGPAAGKWSIPGGHVEWGETLEEAVIREVYEETGLEAVCSDFIDWTEIIENNHHYVVLDFYAEPLGNIDVNAGSDATEAKWIPLREVASLNLAAGLAEFLHEHGIISAIT